MKQNLKDMIKFMMNLIRGNLKTKQNEIYKHQNIKITLNIRDADYVKAELNRRRDLYLYGMRKVTTKIQVVKFAIKRAEDNKITTKIQEFKIRVLLKGTYL